jgi:hypothetical protein
MEGTPIVIGFYCGSQIPDIDERTFNNGVPYADQAEVLSVLPFASRAPYLTVNIAGVEYIFDPSDATLETFLEKIGTLSLSDGQVTLVKMANVATGTVFYRKTAGTGPPEVQTLATLKADLLLTGTNGGDETLASIKSKLSITTLSGSNTGDETLASIKSKLSISTLSGSNTGDETLASIKSKLSISVLSGENTGDQDLSNLVEKVTGYELSKNDYSDIEKAKVSAAKQNEYRIILPSATTVAGRIAAGIVEKPTDWTAVAGIIPEDIVITHNLHREVTGVSVMSVDGGTGRKSFLKDSLAYMGFYDDQYSNEVTIQGLATRETVIIIHLFFGTILITQPA